MPQNSVMRARASIKVLESPIGLITQKRSDERKKSYKKVVDPFQSTLSKSDKGPGVGGETNSISAFLLMGLALVHKNDVLDSSKRGGSAERTSI